VPGRTDLPRSLCWGICVKYDRFSGKTKALHSKGLSAQGDLPNTGKACPFVYSGKLARENDLIFLKSGKNFPYHISQFSFDF
jgi:hypothetical protein